MNTNNPEIIPPVVIESETIGFEVIINNQFQQIKYPLILTIGDVKLINYIVNQNLSIGYYEIYILMDCTIFKKNIINTNYLYLSYNQINGNMDLLPTVYYQLQSLCKNAVSSEFQDKSVYVISPDSAEKIRSIFQKAITSKPIAYVNRCPGFSYNPISYNDPINSHVMNSINNDSYSYQQNINIRSYMVVCDKHSQVPGFINRLMYIKSNDKRRFLFLYYHFCYMSSLFLPLSHSNTLVIDTDVPLQNYLIPILFGSYYNNDYEMADIKQEENSVIYKYVCTKDLPFIMMANDVTSAKKCDQIIRKFFRLNTVLKKSCNYLSQALPVIFTSQANCCEDVLHLAINREELANPMEALYYSFSYTKYFRELTNFFYNTEKSPFGDTVTFYEIKKIKYCEFERKAPNSFDTKLYAALCTIDFILKKFYENVCVLYPDQKLDYDFLFDEDIETYLARFMPTLKLSSSFQKEQFYETVKKLVNAHTISVFQREKQDIEGCASRDEFESSACLLYSKTTWAFNDRAVELIAKSMPEPCSARRLIYMLNEKGVLTYRRINRDSYQNRLRVYFRDGEYTDAELYEVYPESGIIQTDESNYTLDSVEDGLYFHLGKNPTNSRDMYWDFDNDKNLNQHMLITGQSGSGKSCFIENLISQAAEQGITTVVFHEQGSIPCENQCEIIDVYEMQPGLSCFEYSSNDSHAVAERISAALRLTVNQKSMIDQAYEEYLQEKMSVSTGSEAPDEHCSVNDFIQTLITDRTSFSGITPSVQRKLKCLADLSSSNDNVLDWSEYDGKVLALDFRGNNVNPDWYKCYAELYLEDLFLYKQRCAQENDSPTPMIIVSDEFQNMNMMKGAALDKILREGRKYGISLWLASQLVESDSTSRLKYITDQSAMKVYFQAGTERSRKIANLLGKTSSERAGLLSVIRSLEQREFVFQLNGKTPYKCIANEVKK